MRMKEDAMRNGQTKPGYNLQIGTENQFITDFALFPNPTDTLTLIPFLQSFSNRYDRMAHTVVADSGYGSEENYRFMSENGMEAYVKYNYFHMEQRPPNLSPMDPETPAMTKSPGMIIFCSLIKFCTCLICSLYLLLIPPTRTVISSLACCLSDCNT